MALPRELSVNLNLPLAPGTENQELFIELTKVYNALRLIAQALDTYTGVISPDSSFWNSIGTSRLYVNGMCKIYVMAFETISYGETVTIYNDGGVGKARKAISGTYLAYGFCSDEDGCTAGQYTEVTLFGLMPPFAPGALVPGVRYFQSSTPGGIASTGTQAVGFAISSTQLWFNPQL